MNKFNKEEILMEGKLISVQKNFPIKLQFKIFQNKKYLDIRKWYLDRKKKYYQQKKVSV